MAKLSQYRVFVTVYELLGINAAAEQLNLSASAISKQLSALEGRLNVDLFERSNRNIKPTEYGHSFYAKCKSILESVEDAEQSLLRSKNHVSGTIRITLSKSLVKSGIFDKISAFAECYPDLRFDIDLSDEIQDLYESEFDFAFRLGNIQDHSQLVALPLQRVNPIFCATPKYLEKFSRPQHYVDLVNHSVCHVPLGHLSQSVRDFFKSEKFDFSTRKHHQTNDIDVIYQMVHSNMCIGMMLDCCRRRD